MQTPCPQQKQKRASEQPSGNKRHKISQLNDGISKATQEMARAAI